eukprot:TRINITY_DN15855_c0_g1_i2.p1 TRINITY_DN15855_c0_g1~~TRINITY_DN15855_c0_g1_i2.p1  ORF type:complete len:103 (-),score=21.27 TRINITY_DN15855_c0_g1_i2:12-320(-)
MIRRPPRSTHCISSAASDVYKRQYQRRVHEPHLSQAGPPAELKHINKRRKRNQQGLTQQRRVNRQKLKMKILGSNTLKLQSREVFRRNARTRKFHGRDRHHR